MASFPIESRIASASCEIGESVRKCSDGIISSSTSAWSIIEKYVRPDCRIISTVPQLKISLDKRPLRGDNILVSASHRAYSFCGRFYGRQRTDRPKTNIIFEGPPRTGQRIIVDNAVCLKQHRVAFKPFNLIRFLEKACCFKNLYHGSN